MRTGLFLTLVAIAAVAISINGYILDDEDDEDLNCSIIDTVCPGEGDDCESSYMQNTTEYCRDHKCCARPLYCISGTCQEDSRDDNCTNDDDCFAAHYGTGLIACIKKKCVVQGSFNDSCIKDDHCAGDQKCVKDKCNGLALKAKCDPLKGFQCGANKTCVNYTCVAAKAVGDKCSSDEECDVYSICNDGKCIERFSVKEGYKCKGPYACAKGLYCYSAEGKCKKAIKRKLIECTNDTDCYDYSNVSECRRCDATTGKIYCTDPDDVEPDCVAEMAAAYKCYKKNGCAPHPSSSLDTCAQLECTAETNAIFACRSKCEDIKSDIGKKCLSSLMLRYCPLLPTWLRIVIAFSILVVIIVVVFIFYAIYNCCIRKGDEYQKVNGEDPDAPEVSSEKTPGSVPAAKN